ncbi:hypothetical protein EV192_1151, partial [Actinocrispum wychmicini]
RLPDMIGSAQAIREGDTTLGHHYRVKQIMQH